MKTKAHERFICDARLKERREDFKTHKINENA